MNYLIYVTPLLFMTAFVMYSKYQFEDVRNEVPKGKWHPYGAFMRFMFFAAIVVEHYFPSQIGDIILSGVISIVLWDILINVIALHVKPLYNGTTAKTDVFLGKIKWYSYAVLFIAALIYKFTKKQKK